jgi:pimeloyl-ACP methyl ester carboxylesterase
MTRAVLLSIAVCTAFVAVACGVAPSIAANGMLHPSRRQPRLAQPANCEETTFAGASLKLRGWKCHAAGTRRGTLVYLHGIADNRDSSVGVIRRFTLRQFDVIAYDSRGHGASEGDSCTYGFFEKWDLRRVIDDVGPGPVVLLGTSLGGAVALQEAAIDPRVTAVIAAETFSDLATVARERAPWFLPSSIATRAFEVVERRAAFSVNDVNPVRAAANVHIPVLLIHGEADTLTRPEHSRRVYAALAGPKRLLIVPHAGHNHSLSDPAVWAQIDQWIEEALSGHARATGPRRP